MILSFNPCAPADKYLIHKAKEPVTDDEMEAMRKASAVILHQGCPPELYLAARRCCPNVFPDFSARFEYPGKTGQAELFRLTGAPHPETLVYENIEMFYRQTGGPVAPPSFEFPLVFKFNKTDEGRGVFLVENEGRLAELLDTAKHWERTGQAGFILQRYVPACGRALRVVVIYKTMITYWRVSQKSDDIRANASGGAAIDSRSFPELMEKGEKAVSLFCEKTKINLAGFDLVFPESDPDRGPLFLEINYFFGRRGIGGSSRYYDILAREIKRWLNDLGIKTK